MHTGESSGFLFLKHPQTYRTGGSTLTVSGTVCGVKLHTQMSDLSVWQFANTG